MNKYTRAYKKQNHTIQVFLYSAIILLFLFYNQTTFSSPNNEPDIDKNKNSESSKYLSNQFYVRFKPNSKYLSNLNNTSSVVPKTKLFGLIRPIIPTESLLKNNPSRLKMLVEKKGFLEPQIQKIKDIEEVLERTFVAENYTTTELKTFCNKIILYDQEIEDAEPIYLHKLQSGFQPNDELISSQEMLETISALDAFNLESGDPNVIIAISDNGVYQNHSDYYSNIALNEQDPVNGIDDDNNGYIDDYDGFNLHAFSTGNNWNNTTISDSHGTNVAGIAAAKSNNSIGITGVGGLCSTFPIRASASNSQSIAYGYESIIYAGIRAFDVLNCSWANDEKGYSSIEQSIIDFADANGVFIVVAAGNVNFSDIGTERLATFYPSAYKNVFAVGETYPWDELTESSSLASYISILAPGYDNYSLSVNNSYQKVDLGTSFAAPVVAGAVGLLKSHFPNLNNRQIAQLIKQTADDISDKNLDYLNFLPYRLNLYHAILTDPFSIPGIEFEKIYYNNLEGIELKRVSMSDTVNLSFKIKNHLGDGKNLKFKIMPIYYNNEFEVSFLQDEVLLNSINSGEELILNGLKFYQRGISSDKIIFRIDIYSNDKVIDHYNFDYFPNGQVSTFENNKISFSLSDDGLLAYNSWVKDRQGKGFNLKNFGDGLYIGGLVTSVNNNLVSSAYRNGVSDFISLKRFFAPDTSGILTNRTTLTVAQNIMFNHKNDQFIRFDLNVKNTAFEDIKDPAIGYYLDWDLGYDIQPFYNSLQFIDNQMPAEYNGIGGIQYAYDTKTNLHFGVLVASEEKSAELQIASLPSASITNIKKGLNSGTLWQTEAKNTDVSGVAGILFREVLADKDSRNCTVCFAAATSKEDLLLNLKNCLLRKTLSVTGSNNTLDVNNIQIYPNPFENQFIISGLEQVDLLQNIQSIEVIDLLGNTVYSLTSFENFNGVVVLPDTIVNGSYYLKITSLDDVVLLKNLIKTK